MRRCAFLCLVAAVLGVVLSGGVAGAARPRAPRPSIQAVDNPSQAGTPVAIFGRVPGAARPVGVVLWERPAGASRFAAVARAQTDAVGQYAFTRLPGTNRQWFVAARGSRSRVVFEAVEARVTLTRSVADASPGQSIAFAGAVSPRHAGQHVLLQERAGAGWRTFARPALNSDSEFTATHRFGRSTLLSVRALLAADARNVTSASSPVAISVARLSGIHKIRHVVIIMQENRSFDSYFGTFPGADGIPPGVCVPDPAHGGCVAPYHDSSDRNSGGPHGSANAAADINAARMDGYVGQAQRGTGCTSDNPSCSPCNGAHGATCIDVMGYHDAREIPNYWTYARNFVLQDHMFEPDASWSLPAHLFEVSGWSAFCTDPLQPFSCTNAQTRDPNPVWALGALDNSRLYAWTDLTYLLHQFSVSWGYYVFKGTEPDCQNDSAMTCAPVPQGPQTPGIWNPLPHFTDVHQDGQLGNIKSLSAFSAAVRDGNLPAVSWIAPNDRVSEHPPSLVSQGQSYVTGLINAIERSPDWGSTAIFLSWDDWGGFYDHVVPPVADVNGYGLRVPGLLISPYARTGYIDHQTLSHDAFNKFIEDDFLGGRRLDPATDGRPDPRPDVRESSPLLGDLAADFNFSQRPRAPVILPIHPKPGPASRAP